MKIIWVQLHEGFNFGQGIRPKEIDLRGASKIRPMIASMDYDPATGEVVIVTTAQCGVTKGKPGRLRVPAGNVVVVLEAEVEAPAKPEQGGKKAA